MVGGHVTLDRRIVSDRGRERILVVEDDGGLAEVVTEFLVSEGFEVVGACDGREGLAALERISVDLILVDLLMPGVGRMELCREVRTSSTWVPILVMTALSGLDERLEAFALGVDDFLVKPFSLRELVARVGALTRRGRDLRPPMLTVGTLTFDPLRRVLWRSGEEIQLSPREVDLLECLLLRPGLIVSRRQLERSVWGGGQAVSNNLIDQYIARIRRKIDQPFEEIEIETVHSLGFRLRVAAR